MSVQSKLFIVDKNIEWEIVGEGVRRKVLGYDKNIMMVKVEFKKGSVGYVHKHPHTQVSYIESGIFEVQIGSEKKVLKAGDCFFLQSDVEHGVVNIEPGTLIDVFAPMREDFIK